MRISSLFSGIALTLSAATAQSNINQSNDLNAKFEDLRNRELAEGHATCAADISIAAPYIQGRDAKQAVLFHRDRAVELKGKEFFSAVYGQAYEQRIETLNAAHQIDQDKKDSGSKTLGVAAKAFARDVQSCLNQVPSPMGMY